MPILVQNPVVAQATPEQTYNEIWIRKLEVILTGCNGEPAYLNATFGIVARDQNGCGTFNPDFNVTYNVPDVFSINDTSWQSLLGQVIQLVITKAQSAGLLAPVMPPQDQ